jgi:GntR family transcriptional repressor for pyruvate dehydrogenase complex
MSDQLSRIDRIPLITTVMERLQLLIEERGIAAGERLPSERELREGFGVGRSTVREALRALEALGVIEVVQGRGAFVRQRPEAGGGDAHVAHDKLSEEWFQLSAVVEARSLIEAETARLAARRRTDSDLRRMDDALKAFHAAMQKNDLPALVVADVEFHQAVAEAGNPVLAHCLRSLGVLIVKSRQISLRKRGRHACVEARHHDVYEAIVAGDAAGAAEAMARHLSDFSAGLRREMGDDSLERARVERRDRLERAAGGGGRLGPVISGRGGAR